MKLGTLKAALVGATLMVSAATSAFAEWQPSGPIKLMIAFRAGGGVDTSARLLAEELTARHGWEIIPENVAGRGGAAMAAKLKDEPADGLTIGMTTTDSLAYGILAAKNPGFALEDFENLTTITGSQTGLISKTDRGWSTLSDVIEAAKGGQTIAAGAMSAKLADALYYIGLKNGVDFKIVMVQGGKGGLNGVVADDLDIAWAAGPQTKGVQAGDLINLVSAEAEPLAVSPDAPMLTEYGIDLTFGTKFGVFSPAGIPSEAEEAITAAIVDIVNDPSSKLNEFISKAFAGPQAIAGADFDAFMETAQANALELLVAVE